MLGRERSFLYSNALLEGSLVVFSEMVVDHVFIDLDVVEGWVSWVDFCHHFLSIGRDKDVIDLTRYVKRACWGLQEKRVLRKGRQFFFWHLNKIENKMRSEVKKN